MILSMETLLTNTRQIFFHHPKKFVILSYPSLPLLYGLPVVSKALLAASEAISAISALPNALDVVPVASKVLTATSDLWGPPSSLRGIPRHF